MNYEICPCCRKPKKKVVSRVDVGPDITGGNYENGNGRRVADLTAPATPLAAAFKGHRYGLQALKPALEPIIVFQKPYEGRPIDCITGTGAGVLNVDGGRIGTGEDKDGGTHPNVGNALFGGGIKQRFDKDTTCGRWPANFLLLDDEAAAALDRQSGERPVSGSAKNGRPATGDNYSKDWHIFGGVGNKQGTLHNDEGGASRFFFRVQEQLDEADPVRYCAKASRSERDAGLEGMPEYKSLIYSEKAQGPLPQQTPSKPTVRHNVHPTVKPLALTRYLATLLLPPAEYAPRRLFVPFAGVASEMIGAMQAGWDEVTGVELTEEYIPIARARIDYWASKPVQTRMEGV